MSDMFTDQEIAKLGSIHYFINKAYHYNFKKIMYNLISIDNVIYINENQKNLIQEKLNYLPQLLVADNYCRATNVPAYDCFIKLKEKFNSFLIQINYKIIRKYDYELNESEYNMLCTPLYKIDFNTLNNNILFKEIFEHNIIIFENININDTLQLQINNLESKLIKQEKQFIITQNKINTIKFKNKEEKIDFDKNYSIKMLLLLLKIKLIN